MLTPDDVRPPPVWGGTPPTLRHSLKEGSGPSLGPLLGSPPAAACLHAWSAPKAGPAPRARAHPAHLKGQLKRYLTILWRISSHFCSSRLCLRELRLV